MIYAAGVDVCRVRNEHMMRGSMKVAPLSNNEDHRKKTVQSGTGVWRGAHAQKDVPSEKRLTRPLTKP